MYNQFQAWQSHKTPSPRLHHRLSYTIAFRFVINLIFLINIFTVDWKNMKRGRVYNLYLKWVKLTPSKNGRVKENLLY